MTEGYPCPKCGGREWKKTKVHQEIKQCKNCDHSPFLDRQLEARGTFTEWLTEWVGKAKAARAALEEAEAVVNSKADDKVTLKELATLRRANRELKEAEQFVGVGEKLVDLLALPYGEGAVTIHIPEIGLFTQFSWGDYDLFAALKKG